MSMLEYHSIKSTRIKRLLLTFSTGLLLLILTTPFWNSFQSNRSFIRLAKAQPLEFNWSARFMSTDVAQCPFSVDALRSILEIHRSPVYGDELVPKEDLCGVSLDLLAEVHRVTNRDELSDVLEAIYQAHTGDDSSAISTLLDHEAYGLLLAIGTSLDSLAETDRKMLYLKAAFTLNPQDYPIINQLVKYHLARENYCDLAHTSQIGVEYYPESPLYYYYLGRAYEGVNAWQQAGEAYQQALDRFPNYEPYARRLANSLQQAETNAVINVAEVCKK